MDSYSLFAKMMSTDFYKKIFSYEFLNNNPTLYTDLILNSFNPAKISKVLIDDFIDFCFNNYFYITDMFKGNLEQRGK